MESLNRNSSKRSPVEEDDANISTFRRRNKIIILVFVFLIISLSLIIAAFITEHVNIHSTSHNPVVIIPINSFCSVSDHPPTCLKTLNPVIIDRVILDPDQIFTLSLQTAAKDLEHITSLIPSDSSSAEFAFKNCSSSLQYGSGQIRFPLAMMRVNVFVASLSQEQRGEMMKHIIAAVENVMSCVDDLAKVNESTAVGIVMAKLLDVKVYLNSAHDFLLHHSKVLRANEVKIYAVDRGAIFENLFSMPMCGLQLLFMFGLFCALFRIR